MKKHILGLVVALATFLSPLTAVAASHSGGPEYARASGFYVAGSGEMNLRKDAKIDGTNSKLVFEPSWGATASIGYIVSQWRIEAEGSYRRMDVEKRVLGKTNTPLKGTYFEDKAIMGNLYYDLPVTESLSLYVGAGAGMNRSSFTAGNSTLTVKTADKFAWQAMAGLSCDLNDTFAITLGYRYIQIEKRYVNTVGLGLRIKI